MDLPLQARGGGRSSAKHRELLRREWSETGCTVMDRLTGRGQSRGGGCHKKPPHCWRYGGWPTRQTAGGRCDLETGVGLGGHFELGRGPAPSMTVTDGQRRGPRLRPFPPLRLPAAPGHPVVAGLRPQRPASGFSLSLSASSCPPLTSSQPEALPRPISKRGHSMRSWVDMKFLRHHSTRYGGDTDPLLVHSFPPVS